MDKANDMVIKVNNLSKRYLLNHQQHERYLSLRDVITRSTKVIGKRLVSPITFHSSVRNTSQEEFFALKDISFDIKRGDRVGIIGRNGAGKSTLLKILSRITEPTSGRIEISGHVASLLEVGRGFHPELTGRENIFLNGAILGMGKSEIKRKFDEIVDFAEVDKFLDTPVKRYSSGMYVRLAFAVAANLEPDILIVDEVLAVGDAQFQNKCIGRMKDIGHDGRTVLFVSHNMGAVSTLCNKGMLLEKGTLANFGEVDAILSKYMHDGDLVQRSHYINKDLVSDTQKASLNEVYLTGRSDTPIAQSFIDETCHINITWSLHVQMPFLRVGVQVIDSSGVIVLSSMDTDISVSLNDPRVAGLYKERVELPPLLLMPGRYSVQVFAGMPHFERILTVNDVISFDILDRNSHLAHVRGEKRLGFIVKPLTWSVDVEPTK